MPSRKKRPLVPVSLRPAAEPEIRYQAPIREWDVSDRPREKLINRGAAALSDAELIGLIFGNGTRTKEEGSVSAVQLGQALVRAYGSLGQLARRDLRELMQVSGIGPAKAVQLAA